MKIDVGTRVRLCALPSSGIPEQLGSVTKLDVDGCTVKLDEMFRGEMVTWAPHAQVSPLEVSLLCPGCGETLAPGETPVSEPIMSLRDELEQLAKDWETRARGLRATLPAFGDARVSDKALASALEACAEKMRELLSRRSR